MWPRLAVLGLLLASACAPDPLPRMAVMREAPVSFADDLDVASLERVIQRTLPVWRRRGQGRLAAAALALLDVWAATDDVEVRRRALGEHFRIESVHDDLLMTAYYQPELAARSRPDGRFRHPLYRPPQNPGAHSRAEIEAGALSGRGLEIAWTDDPFQLFLLHVQGSGRIRLEDGRRLGVRYAATNGRRYTSLARVMIDAGLVTKANADVPGLAAAMEPLSVERRAALMAENERYTFFEVADAGDPVGSMGVPLTPGRSIASDQRVVPAGTIAYLTTPSVQRLVVSQDTGAGVRGAHVDLFVGAGEEAADFAGRARDRGRLFVLRPR
jgi:membrane-bound lytic murein transglycosylase A